MRLKAVLLLFTFLVPSIVYARPALEPVPFDLFQKLFPLDESIWGKRSEVLQGIENSLNFLRSSQGEKAYQKYEGTEIERARIIQSLLRFRTLLFRAHSANELTKMMRQDFQVVRSRGSDGEGSVKFTGYFQPVYKASLTKTPLYRFPIFSLPAKRVLGQGPDPTRVALEGYDGSGNPNGPLVGREIAYLRSRYEAYMIHVQGSAILELQNGEHLSVGFAGATDYPFQGIPRSFLTENKVRWSNIAQYFDSHPDEFNKIISKNNRFIFFKSNSFQEPIGSLGVPVVATRSIATDKSLMPPGALALIHTLIPEKNANGTISLSRKPQFVFDHDTGKAIKGPGRVDVFMGTGQEAGQLANSVSSTGNLYYLLIRSDTLSGEAVNRTPLH